MECDRAAVTKIAGNTVCRDIPASEGGANSFARDRVHKPCSITAADHSAGMMPAS